MNKTKKTILFMILIIVIIAITFVSYAFIYPVIKGNTNKDIVRFGNKELEIINGLELNELNLSEGESVTKTITIRNNSSTSITFDLIWANLNNEFVNKNVLVYSGTGFSSQEVPKSGSNIPIRKNISIASNVTNTYSIVITNMVSDKNQNVNQGKTISGLIMPIIESYETIYYYDEPDNIDLPPYEEYLIRKIYSNLNNNQPNLQKYPVSQSTYDSLSDNPTGTLAGKLLSTIENGLYKTEGNDGYYTYYFRGVVNNYIKFAKNNITGRILRINEDGSIRVYIPNIVTSSFDSSNNSSYTYLVNDIETNSTIKESLSNLLYNELYDITPYLDYSLFCNEKDLLNVSLAEDLELYLLYYGEYGVGSYEALFEKMTNDGKTIPNRSSYMNETYYLQQILKNCYDNNIITTIQNSNLTRSYIKEQAKIPSYECLKQSDRFYEKIGLLTLDDLMYYGVIDRTLTSADISVFPFSGTDITMTRYANGLDTNNMYNNINGKISHNLSNVSSTSGVVVNIKGDLKAPMGNGTITEPYIIN